MHVSFSPCVELNDFQNILTRFPSVNNKNLMTGPKGNRVFFTRYPQCSLRSSAVYYWETLRSRGNKTRCFPQGRSFRDLL